MRTARSFLANDAVRERVPLLIGMTGASGSGKTASALELAHGIQSVVGGDIYVADSEAKRSLHYAGAPMFSDPKKTFEFKHVPFGAPFSPMDYLDLLNFLKGKGAKTVIVDSMSHEHEGPGGVLEMHDAESRRLATAAWKKKNYGGAEPTDDDLVGLMYKNTMKAWQKPKQQRRELINAMLQMPINFIFCFRAKKKIKVVGGGSPVVQGWQPIAGEEFIYEMTINFLLYPNGGGVPEWHPKENAEREMIKLPSQFRNLFTQRCSLSFGHGVELAKWSEGGHAGGKEVSFDDLMKKVMGADTEHLLKKVWKEVNNMGGGLSAENLADLTDAKDAVKKRLSSGGTA